MKAWEILKNLQDGKKLTHITYKKGQWIKLTCDIHGDLGTVTESGTGFPIVELLNIEDDDGWRIYKEENLD